MRIFIYAAAIASALLALPAQAADEASDPCASSQAPTDISANFSCLFKIFPRSGGSGTIGDALAEQVSKTPDPGSISPTGPLVLVNENGIFIYDGDEATKGKKIAEVITRDDPTSGFYEMTALSHVGPAIAYLAALAEGNSPSYEPLRDELLKRVVAARAALKTNPKWAGTVDAPAWKSHVDEIYRMMDYGLWMANDYLVRVRDGKVKEFTQKSVGTDFYAGGLKHYKVPFNNVMIATFILVSLNSVDKIYKMVVEQGDAIDWKNARVLVHMPIGTNYGGGLTISTNQLVAALPIVTDDAVTPANVLIAPYANAPCPDATVTTGCPLSAFEADTLDPDVYEFYSTRAWNGIYNRTRIAQYAFSGVKDPEGAGNKDAPKQIPGDYPFTKAGDIDGFMWRLKNSLIDNRELLSNAVGFWVPGALKAAKWDASKMKLPGLTAGLPKGVKRYPGNLPKIPD